MSSSKRGAQSRIALTMTLASMAGSLCAQQAPPAPAGPGYFTVDPAVTPVIYPALPATVVEPSATPLMGQGQPYYAPPSTAGPMGAAVGPANAGPATSAGVGPSAVSASLEPATGDPTLPAFIGASDLVPSSSPSAGNTVPDNSASGSTVPGSPIPGMASTYPGPPASLGQQPRATGPLAAGVASIGVAQQPLRGAANGASAASAGAAPFAAEPGAGAMPGSAPLAGAPQGAAIGFAPATAPGATGAPAAGNRSPTFGSPPLGGFQSQASGAAPTNGGLSSNTAGAWPTGLNSSPPAAAPVAGGIGSSFSNGAPPANFSAASAKPRLSQGPGPQTIMPLPPVMNDSAVAPAGGAPASARRSGAQTWVPPSANATPFDTSASLSAALATPPPPGPLPTTGFPAAPIPTMPIPTMPIPTTPSATAASPASPPPAAAPPPAPLPPGSPYAPVITHGAPGAAPGAPLASTAPAPPAGRLVGGAGGQYPNGAPAPPPAVSRVAPPAPEPAPDARALTGPESDLRQLSKGAPAARATNRRARPGYGGVAAASDASAGSIGSSGSTGLSGSAGGLAASPSPPAANARPGSASIPGYGGIRPPAAGSLPSGSASSAPGTQQAQYQGETILTPPPTFGPGSPLAPLPEPLESGAPAPALSPAASDPSWGPTVETPPAEPMFDEEDLFQVPLRVRLLSWWNQAVGKEGLGHERVMLAPFEIEVTQPFNNYRFRYDAYYKQANPDKSEFFWARSGSTGGKGPFAPDTNVNWQQTQFYAEFASSKFSLAAAVPIVMIDPTVAKDTAGIGDIYLNIKYVMLDGYHWQVTAFFRPTFPSGSASRGLGTGHISLEPGVLARYKWSPETYLHMEARYWIPVAGDPMYAGAVFRFSLGMSHLLYESDRLAVIPTFEVVNWKIENGLYTAYQTGIPTSAEAQYICNVLTGVRIPWDHDGDLGLCEVGIVGGVAVTDPYWYAAMARAEFRWSF